MRHKSFDGAIEVFSTCPPSAVVDRTTYMHNVIDVARRSEDAGCEGVLVHADNDLADPWLLSQLIIQKTASLCPLVAVQPSRMHPYKVAKMAASIAHLYRRSIYLNIVAEGFKDDLMALDDTTRHDKRYGRLVEYATIITGLLSDPSLISFEGEFYRLGKLKMTPMLPANLLPRVFVSGRSAAGFRAARVLGATAVKYPKPPGEEEGPPDDSISYGVRVGVIARQEEREAWEVAQRRFSAGRRRRIADKLAMKSSGSASRRPLSQTAEQTSASKSPYWVFPLGNYEAFCPYLVGSYESVAQELARYISLGYKTFILDVPTDAEELDHMNTVFSHASASVAT